MSELDRYHYDLPDELIAQQPIEPRDAARMLVLERASGRITHARVRDLPAFFGPGDLLVTNDTKVRPARLTGRREATGGRWEGLVLGIEADRLQLIAKTRGRVSPGERIVLADRLGADAARLVLGERTDDGGWLATVETAAGGKITDPEAVLEAVGRVPLPGYIRRGEEGPGDRDRYQTVFAERVGSAAAPTAGLHFTPQLLAGCRDAGMGHARVTLHVGLGTFRPIAVESLADHRMHAEWCECPPETAAAITAARAAGRRVLAVGTTTVRTLESAAAADGVFRGPTELFIQPGFSFRAVDCLLTNFHLPRTTLLVLVSALVGRERMLAAYQEAIRHRYRMLSYGDAMLIL